MRFDSRAAASYRSGPFRRRIAVLRSPDPMKPSLEREIRQRIDAFLSEITALVREQALAAVQQALGDDAGRPSSRAPRRRARRKPPTSGATLRPQPRRAADEAPIRAAAPAVAPERELEPERSLERDDARSIELEPAGAAGAE
jgi:hypothetical protein